MSVSSVTSLAVTRDVTPSAAGTIQVDNSEATWARVLVSSIPSEVLAVYTAALGLATSLATASDPHAYLPFRFAWYAVGIIATPVLTWGLYRRKAARSHGRTVGMAGFLRPEVLAPAFAAAAWFTAMPGSPWQVVLSNGAFLLTSMVSTAAGALVVGLITPAMTSPTPTDQA
jgi:bacteriorhodopsin